MLLLLKYGADPHKKNKSGQSAIDVAEGEEVVEALTNFTPDMLEEKPGKGVNILDLMINF